MSDTNEIEKKIRSISKTEAEKAWEEMYEEPMQNLICLLTSTLDHEIGERLILPHEKVGLGERTLAAVYWTGSDKKNRYNIPDGYYHSDSQINRIEFHPELLRAVVKKKWIAKEADRLATLKINHLLASVGV